MLQELKPSSTPYEGGEGICRKTWIVNPSMGITAWWGGIRLRRWKKAWQTRAGMPRRFRRTRCASCSSARDGPAVRDTLLWFALLFLFGGGGYLLWGSGWAVIPFAVYGVLYALRLGLALARIEPRHGLQDGLDEQCAVRAGLVYGAARVGTPGAGATRAITATRSSSGATRKLPCTRPAKLSGPCR